MNAKMLIVVIILGALIYFGFIAGEITQERQIGVVYIGSFYNLETAAMGPWMCPYEYNGVKVDRCDIQSSYPIFTSSNIGTLLPGETWGACIYDGTQSMKQSLCGHLIGSVTKLAFRQPFKIYTDNGEVKITATLYESMVKCADGNYNYRSLCTGGEKPSPTPSPTPTPPSPLPAPQTVWDTIAQFFQKIVDWFKLLLRR